MAKAKNIFFCKECGYESAKWMGQCPACKEWNTFVEEPVHKKTASGGRIRGERVEPAKLSEVVTTQTARTHIGIGEFDRVLGGGIVEGSLVLVGGDPGIGKSTLLLQMCKELVEQKKRVLYISGEESLRQIKMRADRLGEFKGELLLISETNLDVVEQTIDQVMPEVVIIDSIQTMFKEDVGSAPGSVGQVRETTNTLMNIAKGKGISVFIIGHVTKEGKPQVAQPQHPVARRGVLLRILSVVALEMVEHRTEVEARAVLLHVNLQPAEAQAANVDGLAQHSQQVRPHVERVESHETALPVLLVEVEATHIDMPGEKIEAHMLNLHAAACQLLAIAIHIALGHRPSQQRQQQKQGHHPANNPQYYL